MKLKQKITAALLAVSTFILCTADAFAGVNFGNGDGSDFRHGTEDNGWLLKKDNGSNVYDDYSHDLEGLRLTVYDAETQTKVYRTIDVTGESSISSVSNIMHFADGSELIPKTTWLSSSYVGTTYSAVDANSVGKYQRATIDSSRIQGSGYKAEYVAGLSDIDIVSANNSSNYEAIKAYIGDEQFIKNVICHFIPELEYNDFVDGKYKIAFEPVAYFRYDGMNWALSATECGILNHYDKITYSSAWNSTCNLRSLMGPLTHSNLPRSAFLVEQDLGVSVYSPTESDYYSSYHINSATGQDDHDKYNSDVCIIRCMGIGTINAQSDDDDDEFDEGMSAAEYHTNTDVYTSFSAVNIGELSFVGDTTFSIKDSSGETPRIGEQLKPENKQLINVTGSQSGVSYYYAYTSLETEIAYADEDDHIKIYVDNPRNVPDEDGNMPYVSPYSLLGSYKNGDRINLGNTFKGTISYKIRAANGRSIKSGTINVTCPPDGEETMAWIKWHTPSTEQSVTITLESKREDLFLLDDDGNQVTTLTIYADIAKVKEVTPPDPLVSDTRPSWQKIYSRSSVQDKISQYAPDDNVQELSWYTWSIGSSWTQHSDYNQTRVSVITGGETKTGTGTPYWGASTERQDIRLWHYGVDNRYYPSESATRTIGSFETGAVYISTSEIQFEKVTYSVSMNAEVRISPSDCCKTATYNESSGKYTMKSGYGIQISVDAHLSGDTQFCTGTQIGNVLFPEFNYNRQSTAKYNRLLEKDGNCLVFKKNKYSTYNDRVHFTPIWFPDKKNYTVFVEVFDVWCPAGQLSIKLTDQIYIKGNVYDDWHIAPVKP